MSRFISKLSRQRQGIGVVLLIAVGLSLIYAPGLNGPFVLDDSENIISVRTIAMEQLSIENLVAAAMAGGGNIFGRPLASLSFAINHYFSGGFENTFPYKFSNLLIHFINALLIYWLTLLLCRTPALSSRMNDTLQRKLSALTATLWAFHPIQLTNVLYVVQRMNSLSALFVISALVIYLHGRLRLEAEKNHGPIIMVAALIVGVLLGVTAKENAVLLPLLAFSIEFVFFSPGNLDADRRRRLLMIYGLIILLLLVLFFGYLSLNPELFQAAYLTRSFTAYERLLTESRVFWMYLGLLLLPRIDNFSLFHDDIAVSTGLLDPPSTLFALLGLFIILSLALLLKKRYPVAAFSVLWFLAGHMLESTVFDLEIAFEHRNYLPSFGILFGTSCFLIHSTQKMRFSLAAHNAALITIVSAVAFVTWNRASHWSDIDVLARTEVTYHPRSVRANDMAARLSLEKHNDIHSAIRFTLNKTLIAPNEAGGHIELRILLAQLYTAMNREGKLFSGETTGHSGPSQVIDAVTGIKVLQDQNGTQLVYPPSESEHIEKLLNTKPVTVYTIVAIEYLLKCLQEKNSLCLSLNRDAEKWLSTALSNPLVTPNYRAIILRDAARLKAGAGKYTQAAELVGDAIKLAPDQISYRIDLVEYLARIPRITDAKQQLEIVNGMLAGGRAIEPTNRTKVQQLMQILDRNNADKSIGTAGF